MNELSWFIYSLRNRFKIRTLHHNPKFYSIHLVFLLNGMSYFVFRRKGSTFFLIYANILKLFNTKIAHSIAQFKKKLYLRTRLC